MDTESIIAEAQQQAIANMERILEWALRVEGDNLSTNRALEILRTRLPQFIEQCKGGTSLNVQPESGLIKYEIDHAFEGDFHFWLRRPGWDCIGSAIWSTGLICKPGHAASQLLPVPWITAGGEVQGTQLDLHVRLTKAAMLPWAGFQEVQR